MFLEVQILGGTLLGYLYTTLFLILGLNSLVFAGGKDIRLSGTPMQCKTAFSHPQLSPQIVALQLNRQINSLPQGLFMPFFRKNKIKSLSDLMNFFELRHQRIEDTLQKYLILSNKESSHLELVTWNSVRLKKLLRREQKTIRQAMEEAKIDPKYIHVKDLLNQQRWKKLLFALIWSNRERLGLVGELIAGLEINKPEMVEIHPREFFDKKTQALMEKEGIWEKLKNYEIDIIADQSRHWVEVKYLSEGFKQDAKWQQQMKVKIETIDKAMEILSVEKKEKHQFTLLVYGPGKLNPEIKSLVEGLANTRLRIRPH